MYLGDTAQTFAKLLKLKRNYKQMKAHIICSFNFDTVECSSQLFIEHNLFLANPVPHIIYNAAVIPFHMYIFFKLVQLKWRILKSLHINYIIRENHHFLFILHCILIEIAKMFFHSSFSISCFSKKFYEIFKFSVNCVRQLIYFRLNNKIEITFCFPIFNETTKLVFILVCFVLLYVKVREGRINISLICLNILNL